MSNDTNDSLRGTLVKLANVSQDTRYDMERFDGRGHVFAKCAAVVKHDRELVKIEDSLRAFHKSIEQAAEKVLGEIEAQ